MCWFYGAQFRSHIRLAVGSGESRVRTVGGQHNSHKPGAKTKGNSARRDGTASSGNRCLFPDSHTFKAHRRFCLVVSRRAPECFWRTQQKWKTLIDEEEEEWVYHFQCSLYMWCLGTLAVFLNWYVATRAGLIGLWLFGQFPFLKENKQKNAF